MKLLLFRSNSFSLQTKILLVLIGVIVPTLTLLTLIQNRVAQPLLEQEILKVGISTAESIATKITGNRWLFRPNQYHLIDSEIQQQLYQQPSILRIDIYVLEPEKNILKLVSTNIEEDPSFPSPIPDFVSSLEANFREGEDRIPSWDLRVPIHEVGPKIKGKGKIVGMIHVLISTKSISRLLSTLWPITAIAAIASVILLVSILSFFLRRTILNERQLRIVENKNVQLFEQLQEAERQVMNLEKLAAMGQLTANFAHEIGTPLNAIGGHLELLSTEFEKIPPFNPNLNSAKKTTKTPQERLEILRGEVKRIEMIVKGFLQTTAKPVSQSQFVDLNSLLDRTVEIFRPRMERQGVQLQIALNRSIGPIRAIPLEIQQVLVNLVNNSLDSLREKATQQSSQKLTLKISSQSLHNKQRGFTEVQIMDTGMGIKKEELKNVLKPFYTTKSPGEGTGLGLTISHQIISRLGGSLTIDSKEGAWTKVTIQIPYYEPT